MMSSVPVGRPSCVPITLHCTAYCGVKCCWRSLSDGVVVTTGVMNKLNYTQRILKYPVNKLDICGASRFLNWFSPSFMLMKMSTIAE